jgi:hypothetical protein
MTDWDKLHKLLGIAEASLKWPKLKHIHEAAMKELEGPLPQISMVAPLEPEPQPQDHADE